MVTPLSAVQQAPRALAGAADDLQGLAFVGFFQLAARFDGPATLLFDTAERLDGGARAILGLAQRALPARGARDRA